MARHCFVSRFPIQWIAIALILVATSSVVDAQSLAAASNRQPSLVGQTQSAAAQTSAQSGTSQSANTQASTTIATTTSDSAQSATLASATFVVAPAIAIAGAPSNIAAGDLNGDGEIDLLVLNSTSGKVSAMLGKGDGTFAAPVDYAVGKQPISLVTGDFNGDGRLDVAVVNQGDGTISVLLGNGDGTLQSQTVYPALAGANYIVAVDLNGDGKLDLAVSSASAQSIGVLLNNGNGGFARITPYVIGASSNALAFGDFDNDGKQDLAAANSNGTISILLGRGDGSFRSISSVPTGTASLSSIAAGDFNSDGKTDLAVTQSGTKQVLVLLGNGNGSFKAGVPYNAGNNPAQVIVADVNGDKIADLVTANQAANTFSVLLGNGDGTFQSSFDFAVGKSPLAVVAGDFNGDGKTDLALANFGDKTVSVPLGNGDGTFKAARVYGADLARKAIAVGDLDGDGHPDLVVTNFCGTDAACAGNGTATILLATTDGGYRVAGSYPLGSGPVSVALADLNGDKKLDLIAANKADKSLSILLGNGDGTFQSALSTSLQNSPSALAVGDFNGDGKTDVAVAGDCGSKACAAPGKLSVLFGLGDGSLQMGASYAVGYSPVSVATGDINGDGILDLVVANACGEDSSCKAKGTATVLLGNGTGAFQPGTEVSLGMSPSSLALGDLAGRKVLDLAVAYGGENKVAILTGNGDGSFKAPVTYATGTSPSSVVIADFNGDSKPDVAVANFKDATVSVLFGKGDGTLQSAAPYPVGAGPESLAAVQAAQSAPVDLVTTNGNSGSSPMGSDVTVLRNIGPSCNTPTLMLMADSAESTYGDPVLLTLTISVVQDCGQVGGSVDFKVNGNPIFGCDKVSIQQVGLSFMATCQTSAGNQNILPGGDPSLVATYKGNYAPLGLDSNTITHTVDAVPPANIDIKSSNGSPAYGDPYTFTATVTGVPGGTVPTGTVGFTADGKSIQCDSVTLVNGVGTCTISQQNANLLNATMANNPHQIVVTYTPGMNENNYSMGTSSPFSQAVNQATPAYSNLLSPQITYGDSQTTLTGNLCASNGACVPASETVTATINGVGVNGQVIDSKTGFFQITYDQTANLQVAMSPYNISYHYSGDTNFVTVDTVSGKLTVNLATATFTVSSPNPITFGTASVHLTGMLSAQNAEMQPVYPKMGDAVTATINSITISGSVVDGAGNFTIDFTQAYTIPQGTYPIEYVFNSDSNFNLATNSKTTLTVTKASVSSFTLSGPSQPTYGDTVTLTATVDGVSTMGVAAPTGKVEFNDNNNPMPLCTSPLSGLFNNSTATCLVPGGTLTGGMHNLKASYTGDNNYLAPTDAALPLTILPAMPVTSMVSSINPSRNGQPVTFTATVLAVNGGTNPMGTVSFTANGTALSTCQNVALVGGKATCTTSLLAPGSYPIQATYVPAQNEVNYTNATINLSPPMQTVQFFQLGGLPDGIGIIQGSNNSAPPYYAQQTLTVMLSPSPTDAYAGQVNLTCSVMPAVNNAPTCALNTSMSPVPGSAILTISSATVTPIGPYTVSVVGQDNSVGGPAAPPATVAVNIGDLSANQSVTSTQPAIVSVPFVGASSGTVNFKCVQIVFNPPNGTPQPFDGNSYGVTCQFNPSSGTISTDPANPTFVSVTVGITGGSNSGRLVPPLGVRSTFWLGIPAIVLLGGLPFGNLTRKRILQLLGIALVLATILQSMGCGGNGFKRQTSNTQPGNYSVLIQAQSTTDNSVQSSAVVPFTVISQ